MIGVRLSYHDVFNDAGPNDIHEIREENLCFIVCPWFNRIICRETTEILGIGGYRGTCLNELLELYQEGVGEIYHIQLSNKPNKGGDLMISSQNIYPIVGI